MAQLSSKTTSKRTADPSAASVMGDNGTHQFQDLRNNQLQQSILQSKMRRPNKGYSATAIQLKAKIGQREIQSMDNGASSILPATKHPENGLVNPKISPYKHTAPERPVIQRVVDVAGRVLLGQDLVQLLAQLDPPQQHTLNQLAASRTHTYSFANLDQLYNYLMGQAGHDPAVTAIQGSDLANARRARNRSLFHKKTIRESTHSRHRAFHNIPQDQLYRLPKGHYWRRNKVSGMHERFRKRTLPAIQEESLYEYVDPHDPKKENYGYLQGRRVITTRTDPSSSAKYSRSGAAGKILYKDKRGGQISERAFSVGKRKPFKRRKDDKTFTIGHSQAVKNMSAAKDHTGMNSDEQPNMMVPENRTVGEQMKNPALEPENRPYVWNNFYDQNPETTYSGHPIPRTTEASLFHPDGSRDVNIRLTNDGSVDYRKERDQLATQKGVSKISYDTYMREKAQAPFAPPHAYDSEDEDSIADIQEEVPATPAHFPSYLEEDDLETHDEHQYGSMIDHKGQKFTVDTIKKEDSDGKKTYSLSLLKSFQFDLEEFGKIVAKNTPKSQSTTTGPSEAQHQKDKADPKTSKSATDELKDLKRSQANVLRIAAQMRATVSPFVLQQPIVQHYLQALQVQVQAAQGALQDLAFAQNEIRAIYGSMYHIFRNIEPVLIRNLSVAGGNPNNNQGHRLAALTQYFSECGQMAVHNLLALHAAEAENNGFANLQNHLGNAQNLRNVGNFENYIAEGQIRQLLANAGRQGVPVIGNLPQLQAFVATLNQHNPGQGTILGELNARQVLGGFGVQDQEYLELVNMNHFLEGRTNRINMIINTVAHEELEVGHHWITVRLERQHDQSIRIYYLDSWGGDSDYQDLFAGLRGFVGQAQIQNGQQNGQQVQSTSSKQPPP